MSDLRFLTTIGVGSESAVDVAVTPLGATISADFPDADANKLTHAADVDLDLSSTDFTVAGWIKTTDVHLTRYFIYNGSDETASQFSWYMITPLTNAIRIVISDGSTTAQVNSNSVTLGTDWHFFTATFNTTTKLLTCSLDDGSAGSTTATGITVQAPNRVFGMGIATGFASTRSDCKLTCVGLWDRVLTGSEITSLFNSGSNAKLWDDLSGGEQSGAIAFWDLDEISDGSVPVSRVDSSGNSKTLTDVNTTESSVDAP